MPIDIYQTILLALACTLTYCGLYLHFGKIHTDLKESDYKLSRHLMGYAFLVIAVAIAISIFIDMGSLESKYTFALDICCCFVVSKLLGTSFLKLIGRRVVKNRLHNLFIYLFPYIVWITVFINNSIILHISQLFLSIIMLISILLDTKSFYREYNIVKQNYRYLYVNGVGLHINWMLKVVQNIIYFGTISAIILICYNYMPKWILTLYAISFIILTIYVFNRYLLYTNIHSVLEDNNINNSDKIDTTLSLETKMHLKKSISSWVESKKYCNKNINIIVVAREMFTNRLYLSNYINATYKCSFRVWVSQLRINEAKRLMLENNTLTITEIADIVGFKSLTTFTHTFRNSEGVPPSEWLKKSLKKK